MTTKIAPMCYFCKHQKEDYTSCNAFLDGIPKAIIEEYFDHRKPFEGDSDIRFSAKTPAFRRMVNRVYDELAKEPAV